MNSNKNVKPAMSDYYCALLGIIECVLNVKCSVPSSYFFL